MALANPDLELLQQQPDLQNQEQDAVNPMQETPAPAEPVVEDDEIEAMLLDLAKEAEREDQDNRIPLLNAFKRNECYFNNLQAIFYDADARDYRTVESVLKQLANQPGLSDVKIINIYRPLVESVIAALTIQSPNITYVPDDAENPEDIETCKAYESITDLVQKHNNAQLMLVKLALTLYNCGVVAGHNFYKNDPSYGTMRSPKTVGQKAVPVMDLRCPQCSELIDSNLPTNTPNVGMMQCPTCGFQGAPTPFRKVTYQDEVIEWEDTPKGRSGFDLFGPAYVKVSLYARNQEACGYLIFRVDDHVAKFREVFDTDDIQPGGGDTELFERWARIPIEYNGVLPPDMTTCRYVWLRPWWFRKLGQEKASILKNKFPNGVKFAIVGDTLYDLEPAKLDDEWTITIDPRSNYIHAEPPGNAVIPIQDAKNDIFNLGLQSIEYGIPETFAHPKTLNLDAYKNQRKSPGMITRAMPPSPGEKLADGFFTLKTATLSNEYTEFDTQVDKLSQFVSGGMPSIWGGATKTGESTATEASDQKTQSLQRLQLMWQQMSVFWCQLMFKCANDFAKNVKEDERYTKKQNGTYINVWIRKTSLQGTVGEAEPELNGSLPQSWAQKQSFLMQILGLQSPEVAAILLHPNNAEFVKEATGFRDLYIPGENDRNKQYHEFYAICNGQQAPIDIDVDDHMVHCQVLKNILVSVIGLALYETDPQTYELQIEHYRQHQLAIQAKTMAPAGGSGMGMPPDSATNTTEG